MNTGWAFVQNTFASCEDLTIYCRAKEQPQGWGEHWNADAEVVWGYKGK